MPSKRKAAPAVELASSSSVKAPAADASGSASAAVSSAPDISTIWKPMTIPQLKTELRARRLPLTGKKADLLHRLQGASVPQSAPHHAAGAPRPKRARKNAQVPYAEQEQDERLLMEGNTDPANNIVPEDEGPNGEKRLRPFVELPDATYNNKLKAVRTQRMFLVDRQRTLDRDGYPSEKFDIAGSKGNLYEVTIARRPKCTCMDARIRGQRCKHIKYALIIILKAPAKLCYQDAFLSTELEKIFANAPVTRAPDAHSHDQVEDESLYNGKRKPIEGECPICVFDMEPGEDLVWCKAACGQNFHKECFDQWKRSKNGGRVTCVYCRTTWQEAPSNSLAHLKNTAPKVGSYKNVANLIPQYQDGGYDRYDDE